MPAGPKPHTIRVIIVDDEPVARQTLRLLLKNDPEAIIVGECASGLSALELIRRESPDLLFLDVQMPGMSGFEVLKSLNQERLPAVIFTTAYDQYALKAFEVHALDYLLKPFDDERFTESLKHARGVIAGQKKEEMSRQLLDLLERLELKERLAQQQIQHGHRHLSRFLIRSAGRMVMVDAALVEWIEAEGNYVMVFAEGKKHLLREKIGTLETQLDPSQFVRIHRSTIVRTERILTLKPLVNGDYLVTMQDGKEFTLSRTYRERVLASLG